MNKTSTIEAAPYVQLYENIRNNIRKGNLSGKLPSIAELGRSHSVSHNTVKKVLDRLKEQNYLYGKQGKGVYVNEAVAASPAFQKHIVFYLHIKSYHNPFFGQALARLRQLLESDCSFVHLVNSPQQLKELNRNVDIVLLIDMKPDAELDEISQMVPKEKIIFFNQNFRDRHCVGTDNIQGGYMAMKYLYDRGHRHIGVLSRDLEITDCIFDFRRHGVNRFVEEHPDVKLENSELQISLSRPDENSAYIASAELLEKAPDITAVFAFTDILALGFSSYCNEKQIKIPDQISLIGFDNRDFASLLVPPLTTLQENCEALTLEAKKMIGDMIAGKQKPEQVLLPPFLIERESVKTIL